MSIRNVAIIGASGNIGTAVLPEILKSDLNVTVGQDAVISMLPIIALDVQDTVIEAAIAAGVKRFIPSEYGSDSMNPAVLAAVPFFEAKKKYLEYLKSKEDVISWTAVFTGPFFDWGLLTGFTGFDLSTNTATLVDGGRARYTTSNVAQIGRALVAVLKHAAETANQLVYVESFTTTQLEVLAALERATGQQWKVVNENSEDIRAAGLKAIGEGKMIEGGANLITAAVLGREALEDHSHAEGGIWNDRLGLPDEIVEVEVRRIVQTAASKQ
ncbi:NAD(P)-binding protein [Pleurostoma richardsiae]|uniref:NAD(P)-binding protein n=1 Tax=Pleurostoma richardsiae TaxID=41990 RepID=A0AA38VG35_9PEZI|nr:NAD(P)-binding protein [Pleurostoma richardsiae]